MTNIFVDIIRVRQKTLDMTKYLDDLNVPPRYTKIVEKHSDDLKNFVGMRCGVPIFSGTQEVTNPTTKELVGYGQYLQLGEDQLGKHVVFMGSGSLLRRVSIQDGLTGIDEFLERERKREVIYMGRAGVGGTALAGAAGGALEWLNADPTVSLSGVVAGIAVGGLSFAYNRRQRKKELETRVKGLANCFSDIPKRVVTPNLLAPDSYIDDDMRIGLTDDEDMGNVYYIGNTPVDQQKRAGHFWRYADEVLVKHGFSTWKGYASMGMSALLQQILDDIDGDDTFDYGEKNLVGDAVKSFMDWRENAISSMQQLKERQQYHDTNHSERSAPHKKSVVAMSAQTVLSKVLSHKDNTAQEFTGSLPGDSSRNKLTQQIGSIDRQYREDFYRFITNLREAVILSRRRAIQDTLMTTYGGKSNLQKIFWGELSEILARNNIDAYDDSVSRPARFILDLPKMVSEGDTYNLSATDRLNKLYKLFQKICSREYPDVETSTTSLHIFFR
jgi:hypothetical protein